MSGTVINFKENMFPSAHKYRYIRYLLKDIKQQLQTLCTSQLLQNVFLQKTDLWTKMQIYSHCFYKTLQCIATHILQFKVKKEDLITVATDMLKNTPL
jgi:hypothetical protein